LHVRLGNPARHLKLVADDGAANQGAGNDGAANEPNASTQ
jgi:hypothetical protein